MPASRPQAPPTTKALPRKEFIQQEATRLFSNNGYDGTSMREIARASGITEAAIYRHFDNKAHLYEEVIRAKARSHNIGRLRDECPAEEDVEGVLSRIARHVLDLARKDPQLMRLMFQNSLERGDFSALLFMEVRLPYIRFLTEELQRRMDAGEVRQVDPFITSRCFVGMVMDCALNIGVWEEISGNQWEADDVVCNNVPIFARGLLVHNGSA